jgi:hypothetical protein
MVTGLNGLAKYLKTAKIAEFCPAPFYEPETDSLIFYIRNEQSYSRRLNAQLTLFLATKDRSFVGCEIKGVRQLIGMRPSTSK